jgi:membrane-associated phospholipid phosphatase
MPFHRSRRRKLPALFVLIFSVASAGALRGQSPTPASPPAGSATPAQTTPVPAPDRDVSWLRLPSNILHDQKGIWLFPAKIARGQHLFPAFAVIGTTGGLIAADPHDAPYFRRTGDFHGFNRVFSGGATGLATTLTPLSFYAIGLIRKDSYQQKTSLLAGEALLDSLILSSVMKVSTLRLRPSDIPPQGDFSDTFFQRRQSISSGSFPSGHTIAAFSVATVFARRYGRHRWVPWVAYGAAGLVGFSRITLQAHFPSDVFLGAALGYSISRFAVLGP